MKHEPSSPILHWEIPSTTAAAEGLSRELMERVRKEGFDEEEQFAIHLALDEALVNAVQHGNGGDPAKKVLVDCEISDERFEVTITDQGPGFDPKTIPDPRQPENLYKCSGRGVLLIFAYMDRVEFSEAGNSIRMVKYREGKGPRQGE